MRVLGVGAHPDDIEHGAGGTVARHVKQGDDVHFLVLTFGEKGGDKLQRKHEAEKSANILKAKSILFGGIPDTKVTDGIEAILAIEEVIDKIMPDRVYTQCPRDRHQDHRNAALATFSAARKVKEVFSYESPDSYPNFAPQYYVQITDTMSLKVRALRTFHSQQNRTYVGADAVRGLAQFRGYQVGVPYAEAFEVVRMIGI
jgi:LmbE family N-acetylglucosaminyl deacetylase